MAISELSHAAGSASKTPVSGKPGNSEVDTSRPWTEQMSKSCLIFKNHEEAKSQDGKEGTPFRRSCRQISQAIYQDAGAELIFYPKNIRKKLNFKSTSITNDGDEDRPRKRARRNAIDCECHVTIWDNREDRHKLEALAKSTQFCYIIPRGSTDNGKIVDIELTEPIVIKAADLRVPILQGGKTSHGIGDKYFLELKILPCREGSEWPPIPVLSRSESELFSGLGKVSVELKQKALVARYMHLPLAPDPAIPLSVFYVEKDRAYKTKYGLEVKAEWTKPSLVEAKITAESKGNEFKTAPWAIDNEGNPFGRKPSDPKIIRRSSRRSLHPPENEVEISYLFDAKSKDTHKASRKATLKGFRCPACRIGEFESLSELQFHFTNSHHKYKFELESEEKDHLSGELKSVAFIVNSAGVKRPKDPNNLKSEWEWNWTAPMKAFDLDAYVKGEHSWVGVQNKKRGPPPPAYSSDAITALRQKNDGFLPPEEVPELPTPVRKRHPVVETKTRDKLALYTSVSHRELRLSEEPMSESDDDMDSEWLKEKHSQTIDQVEGLTVAQKTFRKRWDRHRDDEGCGHPKYLADSLVRFVRKYRVWFTEERDAFLELVGFMHLLKARRVINESVIKGCYSIIWVPDLTLSSAKTEISEEQPQLVREIVMTDATAISDKRVSAEFVSDIEMKSLGNEVMGLLQKLKETVTATQSLPGEEVVMTDGAPLLSRSSVTHCQLELVIQLFEKGTKDPLLPHRVTVLCAAIQSRFQSGMQ